MDATSIPLAVQVLLGILPLAPFNTLVVDPKLPDVIVHDLRVGDARVTLRCRRDARGQSHFDVLHQARALHVVRQPPRCAGGARRAQRK